MSKIQSNPKGKHDKYKSSNPISNYLIINFFNEIERFVQDLNFNSILDIGCGEGRLLSHIKPHVHNKSCYAIDIDSDDVVIAKNNLPFCTVDTASIYELPFEDNSIDLVICTEVLEHLDKPVYALDELYRVTSKYALLSVPREPLWRILNMLRGAYWSDWGNTPDHVNHWGSSQFKQFIETRFSIISSRRPIPWTIILAEK